MAKALNSAVGSILVTWLPQAHRSRCKHLHLHPPAAQPPVGRGN